MTHGPPQIPGKKPGQGFSWGMGCLGVGIALVLIVVALVIYVFLPGGKRLPLDTLVGEEAVAVVRLTDCREDIGMQEMGQRLTELQAEMMRKAMEDGSAGTLQQNYVEFMTLLQSGKKIEFNRFPEAVGCISVKPGDTNLVYSGAITIDMLPRIY
jgi:hypothetical protein